jgi:hypothetical protein
MTDIRADILIFGTGNFAGRIALDLAATASEPVTVAIAGRNRERLDWLRTAGKRARRDVRPSGAFPVASPRPVGRGPRRPTRSPQSHRKWWSRPRRFRAAPSSGNQGNAWTRLVAEGGLSATAVAAGAALGRGRARRQGVRPQAISSIAALPTWSIR